LKAQILIDNSEFNFTSHQELWRHVIWLQYYETSVSTIFDYIVQNSKHPYEHVIELSFKTIKSKFSTQPNLQYTINSKGYKNRNLLFYGIRVTIEI